MIWWSTWCSFERMLVIIWYARPQLFFTCHLRPTGGRPPENPSFLVLPSLLHKSLRCRKAYKAWFKWRVFVNYVCTSPYQYLPVHTGMYWNYLNFTLFEIWHHHSYPLHRISTLLYFTPRTLPGCMRKPHVFSKYILVWTGMYWHVLKHSFLYWHVPVRTRTDRYMGFCPILFRCIGFQMNVYSFKLHYL